MQPQIKDDSFDSGKQVTEVSMKRPRRSMRNFQNGKLRFIDKLDQEELH